MGKKGTEKKKPVKEMENRKTLCAIRETSNDAIKTDTRRFTITEKSRRRNSNLNLEKDTTSFLKRKSISKGSTEKLMEGRRKSRAGSIFSLSKQDGSGTDSRRQSMVGNRRQGGSKFKDLVKRTRVLVNCVLKIS